MTWYSFVFPNTGLLTATFAIGGAVDSPAIEWVGSILTIVLIMVWLFVFVMMIRAVWNRQILWPQKQEDRDEGGWKDDEREKAYFDYKKARAEEQRQNHGRRRERAGSIASRMMGGSRGGDGGEERSRPRRSRAQSKGQDGALQPVEERYRERDNEGNFRDEHEHEHGGHGGAGGAGHGTARDGRFGLGSHQGQDQGQDQSHGQGHNQEQGAAATTRSADDNGKSATHQD